jgi:hypothetical protein
MIWWFLILAASVGAVLWVGIASYLRVRGHLHPNRIEPPVGHAENPTRENPRLIDLKDSGE